MSDKKKSKLTDEERHARFVEMAHEVDASEDPEAFERAFKKIVPVRPKSQAPRDS